MRFFGPIGRAAITCCRLRDFGVVLGINFITVAACREGIVEYLGFQNGDRDACVF